MNLISKKVPALGEYWNHSVSNRILLKWRDEDSNIQQQQQQQQQHHHLGGQGVDLTNLERIASVMKSSYRPSAEVRYTHTHIHTYTHTHIHTYTHTHYL